MLWVAHMTLHPKFRVDGAVGSGLIGFSTLEGPDGAKQKTGPKTLTHGQASIAEETGKES